MSIVLHPVSALNGQPAYTADDYRHVVNPFLFPSDGTVFNCVQGVRCGGPVPLATIEGLVVTVKPHCGTMSPWGGNGAYTYMLKKPMTVKVPDSTGDYKIVVTVQDPSLSHGETPGALLLAVPASTSDTDIDGLVVARVTAGVVSDRAPILHPNMLVEVFDVRSLEALSAADGQEALVSSTGKRYVMENGAWHDTVEVASYNWLGGKISFLYGASSCTVQVTDVMLDGGSWSSASFQDKVKPVCRPAVEVSSSLCVENGGAITGLLTVGTDGTVSVANKGGTGSNGKRRGSVSWPITRRW